VPLREGEGGGMERERETGVWILRVCIVLSVSEAVATCLLGRRRRRIREPGQRWSSPRFAGQYSKTFIFIEYLTRGHCCSSISSRDEIGGIAARHGEDLGVELRRFDCEEGLLSEVSADSGPRRVGAGKRDATRRTAALAERSALTVEIRGRRL